MKRAVALAGLLALAACSAGEERRPAEALFVGIDVSGSFVRGGHFESALDFLSEYLYARLNEKGKLQPIKTLFVGTIGGELSQETKSFYPIHDFQGKTAEQIRADLTKWFPQSDRYTDFNIFFKQVSDICQKRNLALVPVTVVLLTDGIPDAADQPGAGAHRARFNLISVSPLEYVSRKVTLRVLFPTPMVANRWETYVARQRVRLWTVDEQVMEGWKAQFDPGLGDRQERFWKWVADNVEYRVKPSKVKPRPVESDSDMVFEPGSAGSDDPLPAAAPLQATPVQAAPAPAPAPVKALVKAPPAKGATKGKPRK